VILLRIKLIMRQEIITMRPFTGIFPCQCTPIGPFTLLDGIIRRLALLMGREMEVGEREYVVLPMNLRMLRERVAPQVSAAEVHLLVQIVQGIVAQVGVVVEGAAQEEDVVEEDVVEEDVDVRELTRRVI
jgi:hypothetical protein